MRSIPLSFCFAIACFFAVFGSVFIPGLRFLPFTPFLAIVFTRKSLIESLWLAFLSGFVMDMLSSQMRFGLNALNYCFVTLFIFHQKRHFFDDKPLAICLFTTLISCISTIVQLILLYCFDRGLTFNWSLALTDLAVMPLVDGMYTFLGFVLVFRCFVLLRTFSWGSFSIKKIFFIK